MIFTDRTITVRKGESRIDEPIVVYRGDYELEVRFTILNSRFKFMSGTNMIESEKASYGQLAILTPYGGNIFSDIVRCNDGSVTFILTAEMLNQIEEVGLYSFQIRLMDYNKESRVSIPPIEFGIEVREPIASEDHDNSVNNAIVGYSIAKVVDPKEENVGDTFDESGNYNKTKWETGDRISEGKLNKIEDAIDKINENEVNNTAVLSRRIDNNFNVLDSIKVGGGTLANMSDLGQDIKEALLIPGSGIPIVGEDCVNIPNLGSDLKTDYAKNLLKQSMVQINKALHGIDNKDKNCINGTHLWDNVGTSVISYIPVNSKVYDIVFKYNGNLALNRTRMTILGYNSEGYPTSRLDTIEAGKITVPVGTSYICLQTNSDFDFTNLFIVEHFDGIDYSKIEDVYLKFLMKSDVGKIKSKLYGKKVAVLGDSITGTDYATPTWWQMIAEETGCSITNYGVSGTSIAFNEDREQFGKCFAERYTTMSDDFDIVFVMGGTNDRGRTPLGEWHDDNISTMYGALNTLIKGLIDKFPNAIILFATPIQEKVSWNSNYKFDATQSFFNEVQSTTEIPSVQYISEAIKVKCRQYAIPCKNLFDESRITGYNESDWLDTLHPSVNGQNKLKVAIQNFWENSI